MIFQKTFVQMILHFEKKNVIMYIIEKLYIYITLIISFGQNVATPLLEECEDDI